MPESFKSPRGRILIVFGDPHLLTMDRLAEFGSRIDTDPRLVSLSLMPSAQVTDSWLRATAPAGPLIVIASDAADLAGPLPGDDSELEELLAWTTRASNRGLWHDWWLTNDRDVAKAVPLVGASVVDEVEADDPSGSHFATAHTQPLKARNLSVAVDVTWLGPHETGAQVLTTAAVQAMANDDRIASITLVGLPELPAYAAHLVDHPKVVVVPEGEQAEQADVVWYPNQIDGRSNIVEARQLGRRVITTYLDLIAYDIPRYHGATAGWAAYRALQRKVALSVDGVTTISGDVAVRLHQEVPRLEHDRIKPIQLGLDHIAQASAPEQPDADLADIVRALDGKRFIAVLGNDFQHKNRDFAIAVWQQVLANGESCDLVLAGLHVRSSSSKVSEEAVLAKHVDLRGTVHSVGHISSGSRAWLLANASAMLYPSSAEGFGFVPYEAAALGTPTTFADFGPLKEVAQISGLPQRWTVAAFADDLTGLLAHEHASAQRVAGLHRAITALTWEGFAGSLIDFFQVIIAKPTVLTSTINASAAAEAALSSILSSRTWRARESLRKAKRRLRRG
jgi:glycosyltransferase involved in cell wall biosynthesis